MEAAIQRAPCEGESPPDTMVFLPLVRAAGTSAPMTPTPVTPTPASVTIALIEYDPPGDDVAGEYVLLRNSGGSAAMMTGWTLRDAANTVYTSPAFTLAAGAEVRVWTKAGTDDGANLYWGRTQAVWNNTGGDNHPARRRWERDRPPQLPVDSELVIGGDNAREDDADNRRGLPPLGHHTHP